MKTVWFILVMIGLGIFVYRAPIKSFLERKVPGAAPYCARIESFSDKVTGQSRQAELRGTYTQQLPFVSEVPLLGLRFVDRKTVCILRGGEALGNAVWSIRGDRVTVKHTCGTWEMQIRPDGLHHPEFGLFVKTGW